MSSRVATLRLVRGGGADRAARGDVIAVAAGKGGAGASTTAALLALAAHAEGRAVLLVDAQPLGTLRLMLGVTAERGLDALRDGVTPEQLVTRLGAGLDFIAAGESALPSTAAERRALLRRLTGLFEAYDLVIVDAGARVEGVVAACDAGADTLLAVVAPDPISLAAAHAVFKTAAARATVPRFAAIVNPAGDGAADATFAVLQHGVRRFLGRDLLRAGSLPDDAAFRAACADGVPLVAAALQSTLFDAAAATLRTVSPIAHADQTSVPRTSYVK